MHTDDTIAAIATPIGHGGIGIIRLSGRDAIKIADRIFHSPKGKSLKKSFSRRIFYGHIINPENNEIIDEVLVSIMHAPHTYTKEDIAEINCHGGPAPLRRVLELVLKNGARLAEPGEFTKRAFLNGRIDLAQAEAVLDVINAMTEQSGKAAVEQLSGGFSKKIEALRDKLVELTAIVEAYIDFPEDDTELSASDIRKRASEIEQELKQLIDSSRHGIILREGLKTAIIGRPNVGKSSLLNALLERDRAIVTDLPGTTRDIIEEYLDINGLPIKIIDTAGIRKYRDIAEKEGVERSLRAMEGADLVLLVLDGSEELHDTDRELMEKSNPAKTILVINKIDLPQKIDLKNARQAIVSQWFKDENENVIPAKAGIQTSSPDLIGGTRTFEHWVPGQARNDKAEQKIVNISALKVTGLDELKGTIVETALHGKAAYTTTIVTNVRHVMALEKTYASMNSFMEGVNKNLSPEFLSVELRDALDAIGEIIGITTSEDILNKIFSNFCIGK
ncbi:MAG: tRNA uridine-5-carboxymethylaminomethyl(34) synthesis GTPase MnmE [Nitrospirae bacterium]|nr:tRNA uridine-5-carboxymethylaminomethyl(34) synthesis GTPase MnmE [Nitrospirota bacterium]